MLLHWAHISPQTGSDLAAVRFNVPVRISSIRIFPAGAKPFALDDSIISATKPSSFSLNIYLSAHAETKDKPARPANALASSRIVYTGSNTNFNIDMGDEYTTRLLILQGAFEVVTLAVYGSSASEAASSSAAPPVASPPLITSPARNLPSPLDPASSEDPTKLAKQLLGLIPRPTPPLALLARLMFCVKATDDMWDDKDFPFIYAGLDVSASEFELDDAMNLVELSIPHDVSPEKIEPLAERLSECFSVPGSEYKLCCFLSDLASQPSSVVQTILRHLDIIPLLDVLYLEERSLLRLKEAAVSIDIAQQLNTSSFIEPLQQLASDMQVPVSANRAAGLLLSRIQACVSLQEAFTDSQGDFEASMQFLQELGREEIGFGTWLISMISDPARLERLRIDPSSSSSSDPGSSTFNTSKERAYAEFLAFVRTYIAIACTLVILSWADSLGEDPCIERILSILCLWQTVPAYKSTLNQLLLLEQLTDRIEWITSDNDPPRESGFLAEKILSCLADDPRHLTNPSSAGLVGSILSLKQPLSFVDEEERVLLQKLAQISREGLPAAMRELAAASDQPISLMSVRTLHLAISIIYSDIQRGTSYEQRTLQAFWDEKRHSLVNHLIELFCNITKELESQILARPSMSTNRPFIEKILHVSQDLLNLINYSVTSFPPSGKLIRLLVIAITDSSLLAGITMASGPSPSSISLAAQQVQSTHKEALHCLSIPGFYADHGKPGLELVLESLLEHGLSRLQFSTTHRIRHIQSLIMSNLAFFDEDSHEDERRSWVRAILPNLLPQIIAFFAVLEPENKCRILEQIHPFDEGVIGLEEWILTHELDRINEALSTLSDHQSTSSDSILRACTALRFQFLKELWDPDASTSKWSLSYVAENTQMASSLQQMLQHIIAHRLGSPAIVGLVDSLVTSAQQFSSQIKHDLVVLLVRHVSVDRPSFAQAAGIAEEMDTDLVCDGEVRQELGIVLREICLDRLHVQGHLATGVINLLSCICSGEGSTQHSIPGVTSIDADILFQKLAEDLPSDYAERLDRIKTRLAFDEDDITVSPPSLIEGTLQLSIQEIELALGESTGGTTVDTTPSTPKQSYTPEVMNLVTTSPLSALFHSPVARTTSLTKTYLNNDFRELRQLSSSSKQNISSGRHPSIHVDVS